MAKDDNDKLIQHLVWRELSLIETMSDNTYSMLLNLNYIAKLDNCEKEWEIYHYLYDERIKVSELELLFSTGSNRKESVTLEVCGEKEEFVAVHYPSDKNSFFQNKDLKLFVAMKRFRDPKWKLYTYEALGGAILNFIDSNTGKQRKKLFFLMTPLQRTNGIDDFDDQEFDNYCLDVLMTLCTSTEINVLAARLQLPGLRDLYSYKLLTLRGILDAVGIRKYLIAQEISFWI